MISSELIKFSDHTQEKIVMKDIAQNLILKMITREFSKNFFQNKISKTVTSVFYVGKNEQS